MKHGILQPLALSVMLGTAMLSGCGGGGGSSSTPTQTGYKNAVGPVDPVQTALTDLGAGAAATPTLGPSLQTLTGSLVCLTDAVDVLSGSLQTLAQTQSPQDFAQLQSQLGPAIECGLERLTAALEILSAPGLPLAGAPSASTVQDLLGQIADVQSLLNSGGTSPTNLTQVTNGLEDVAATLDQLSTQIPSVPNAPQVEVLTQALSGVLLNVSTIVDAAGHLNEGGVIAGVNALTFQLAGVFGSPSLTGIGVVDSTFQSLALQVVGSVIPAQQALQVGLFTVIAPLFNALETILGGSSSFTGLLSGLMSGNPAALPVQPLLGLLSGGGVGGGGLPIPLLGDLLGLLG